MLRRLLAAGLVVLVSLAPSPRHDTIDRPGSLVLVGGGTVSPAVKRRFLELAGGPQARIVVIPSASYLPEAVQEAIDFWQEEGVRVEVLDTTSREEADRPGFADPLRVATGVWIPGGDQNRFMAIYSGTAVERELLALYRRGGVIGGTSAGASVVSLVMVSGEGEGRGLGLLDRMVVDQ